MVQFEQFCEILRREIGCEFIDTIKIVAYSVDSKKRFQSVLPFRGVEVDRFHSVLLDVLKNS